MMMLMIMRRRRRRRRTGRRRRLGGLLLSGSWPATTTTGVLQFFPLFLLELFMRLEVLPQIVFRFRGERGFLGGFV